MYPIMICGFMRDNEFQELISWIVNYIKFSIVDKLSNELKDFVFLSM